MSIELPFPFNRTWPLGQAVQLACLLEASAPKAGNVHPNAHFADMQFAHFLASGVAIGEVFAETAKLGVGELVLQSVLATQAAVGCNTNLGTLLLFAPLAKAHARRASTIELQQQVAGILRELQPQDCQAVYAAIRVANPGGLGEQARDDVASAAPADLIAAMSQVASVDAVARQYTNCFADVFDRLVPWFKAELEQAYDPLEAICRLQIRWLAHEPDGLIMRKVGQDIARQVQSQAADTLAQFSSQRAGIPRCAPWQQLDQFLRSDGHRRNPGTTADLIAATLLVLLLG